MKPLPLAIVIISACWLLFAVKLNLQIVTTLLTYNHWIWLGMAGGVVMTLLSYQTVFNTYIHEMSHLIVSILLGYKINQFQVNATGTSFVNYTPKSTRFVWLTGIAPYLFTLRIPSLLLVIGAFFFDNPLSSKEFSIALGALLSHSLMVIMRESRLNLASRSQHNDFRHFGVTNSLIFILICNLALFLALSAWLLPSIAISDISSLAVKNGLQVVSYLIRFL